MSSPRQYGTRFKPQNKSPRSADKSKVSSFMNKGIHHAPKLRAGKKRNDIVSRAKNMNSGQLDVTIDPPYVPTKQPPIRAHSRSKSDGVALVSGFKRQGPAGPSKVAVPFSRIDMSSGSRDLKKAFAFAPRRNSGSVTAAVEKLSPSPVKQSPRSRLLRAVDLTSKKDDIFLIDDDDDDSGKSVGTRVVEVDSSSSSEGEDGEKDSRDDVSFPKHLNIKPYHRRKSSKPEKLGTVQTAELVGTCVTSSVRMADSKLLRFSRSQISFRYKGMVNIRYSTIVEAHYLMPTHSTATSLLAIKSDDANIADYDYLAACEEHQYIALFIKSDIRRTLVDLEHVMAGVFFTHRNEAAAAPVVRKIMNFYRVAARAPSVRRRSTSTQSRLRLRLEPEVMLEPKEVVTWPPPPAKDGITLRTGDVTRLKRGEFLNDQLIDFFLKYLSKTEASENIHIFNSHFYKRGSQKPQDVLRWAKGLDVFAKDYLIIPVHDHSHWLLAVVCHPGAVPERAGVVDLVDAEKEEIKILFFDSLSTSVLVAARRIRSFLQVMWDHDHPEEARNFSLVQHVQLDVPQQDNYSDCGVFVLHYTELFLKDPRSEPAQFDSSWFSLGVIRAKRFSFKQLIKKLMLEAEEEPDAELVKYLDGNFAASERPVLKLREKVVADERDGVVYLDSDDDSEKAEGREDAAEKETDDDELLDKAIDELLASDSEVPATPKSSSRNGVVALGKRKLDEKAEKPKAKRLLRDFFHQTAADADRAKDFEKELFDS